MRSDPYGTRYFKCVQRLQETMSKELKENIRMMSHPTENINKDVEIIKKESEILELRTIITEMRISPQGLNSRFKYQEEKKSVNLKINSLRLSRLSNRKNEEKKNRDQGDINKHTNICIVGVQEREEKQRSIKNIWSKGV